MNKLKNFVSDLIWEIQYYYKEWVVDTWYSVKHGLINFWKYRSIVWYDRWYDYDFMLNLLEFKLKEMDKHWDVDTYYVGAKFTKGRLRVLLRDLETYRSFIEYEDVSLKGKKITYHHKNKEYFKLRNEFLKSYGYRFFRTVPRLWD
jgi:hypothetical protein